MLVGSGERALPMVCRLPYVQAPGVRRFLVSVTGSLASAWYGWLVHGEHVPPEFTGWTLSQWWRCRQVNWCDSELAVVNRCHPCLQIGLVVQWVVRMSPHKALMWPGKAVMSKPFEYLCGSTRSRELVVTASRSGMLRALLNLVGVFIMCFLR